MATAASATVPHLELSFELGALEAAAAEAVCFAHGAQSITYSDELEPPPGCAPPGAAPPSAAESAVHAVFEPLPGELRLWSRTRLRALFPAEQADAALIVALAAALGLEPACLQARALADRAWEREWLRDFHPLRFGQRLWICPRAAALPEAARDGVIVRLDPGLAFGTGTHPSTALCLQWLESAALTGRTLIDYGCGSGVLSIAALKLGARAVHAFDIDPQALLATRENAEFNGVRAALRLCAQASQLPSACELLVANILSETLLALAPSIAPRVRPGGELLLAGILESQAAEVAACYAAWFDMSRSAQRDGWVALQGRAKDPLSRTLSGS